MIYLDFNRTTPIAPSVLEAMQPFWAEHFMLPGQEHPQAQAVGEAVEHARECVAILAGCDPFEVVFTSGGTEANNLGVLGVAGDHPAGHLLISAVEHDAVTMTSEKLEQRGWDVEVVPCDGSGWVDPDEVQQRIRPGQTRLVCVQLANATTGVVQSVREIADRCHNHGVPLHCDGVQAFGKMPVDVVQLRADTVSISGHRMYGPKGVGALYVRRGLDLSPMMFGDPREMGLRPGSENIPSLIGLGAASNLAARCCVDAANNLSELRDRFVAGLQSAMPDVMSVVAEDAERLPNTVSVQLNANAKAVQRIARTLVIATARSESPPDEMTRALKAIGCSDSEVNRTLRISLGWTTSRDQIDRAVDLLAEAADTCAA
ncbi:MULTISPECIES: cysteine desulfurase family protein [Crateriforma]|nr:MULTISPECIES: cysteine desulfurase family protein [Crateriforma]